MSGRLDRQKSARVHTFEVVRDDDMVDGDKTQDERESLFEVGRTKRNIEAMCSRYCFSFWLALYLGRNLLGSNAPILE